MHSSKRWMAGVTCFRRDAMTSSKVSHILGECWSCTSEASRESVVHTSARGILRNPRREKKFLYQSLHRKCTMLQQDFNRCLSDLHRCLTRSGAHTTLEAS